MSRFDSYLVKKNIKIQKSSPGSALVGSKARDGENTQRLERIEVQKISANHKSTESVYNRALSPVLQNNPTNSILKVISLKKAANREETTQIEESNERKYQSCDLAQKQISPQQILIGPFDLTNFEEEERKLEQLMTECNKTSIIEWIRNKCKSKGIDYPKDFRNIESIEDEQFWCDSMQSIIGFLLKEQKEFNSCIQMLPQFNFSQEMKLTRKQVFLLIASMFLCIIPPQMNNTLVSFAELMAVRPVDQKYKQKPPTRLQKLKCVVNYLKYMLNNQEIFNEEITYQRVYACSSFSNERQTSLTNVIIEDGKIESGYGKGIIIDFANSNVGGGFLTNGAAQQEILFSAFPEMIITKLLCQTLRDNEAIVVQGAKKINNYSGYSYNFKFKGTYFDDNHCPEKSCIVAIDAVDFMKGIMNKSMQYSQKFIKRELHKIYLGVQAAAFTLNSEDCQVYTGRWGCGAFGADEYLKFCIQWIACSQAGLSMRFFANEERTLKELALLVSEMKHLTTLDLFALILSYGKSNKICNEKGFLEFLKYC